jgi:Wiskott-Aldrich syndrome protein
VSSAEALSRAKSAAGQGGNKIPLVNGKVDKSRIGAPSNFEHRAHIGWNQDVGFDVSEPPLLLFLFAMVTAKERVCVCGISTQKAWDSNVV